MALSMWKFTMLLKLKTLLIAATLGIATISTQTSLKKKNVILNDAATH